MSGEQEGEGEGLAGFIVGALHDSGALGPSEVQRATAIAAEEMGAYWCSWCSLKAEAARACGRTMKPSVLRRMA